VLCRVHSAPTCCSLARFPGLYRERRANWRHRRRPPAKTCHHDAVSTVQVITAPTDWPAVISAIVTGVAAAGGILGGAWQAARARRDATADLKRSLDASATNLEKGISAEDKRAMREQKMRIYAAFQGTVDTVIDAAGQRPDELGQAQAAMHKALAEVVLVAPTAVGDLAGTVSESAISSTKKNVDPHGAIARNRDMNRFRDQLYQAMRADLGTDGSQPAHAVDHA
jgi:hypothetical protein